MRISVVLPTHNRADLLREAVASVRNQSWPDWEMVVVDDGSIPPAHRERDEGIDHPVKWLRNEMAQGLSNARNRGIEVAEGEVVTFLDDDDLLAGNALEVIAQQFQQHPDIECLFINIDPFGAAGIGMRQNQTQALNAALTRMELSGHAEKVLSLGPNLFEALLDGLPLAFQRVAIRRSVLRRVGLYHPGPFGDLEWNYRLALRCRCVLLLDPLYKVRCEGQSFFTRGDAQEKLLNATIRIRQQLAELPEMKTQPRLVFKVRIALARSRFNKAYFSYKMGRVFPWREFFLSARVDFGWSHISLLSKVMFSIIRKPTP